MRESKHNIFFLTALAAGAVGAIVALGSYARGEVARRGYPSWDECHCNFKSNKTIFLVWYSRNQPRGETIVLQEWGVPLTNAPLWLRRLLHHGTQTLAIFSPLNRYVERVVLSPQEARQFAHMLYSSNGEDEDEQENTHIIWRREILHVPHHLFDAYIRRLYPIHVTQERSQQGQSLPILWDPKASLPLPSEGALLETPAGTRIDTIGWSPTQISYCTARVRPL